MDIENKNRLPETDKKKYYCPACLCETKGDDKVCGECGFDLTKNNDSLFLPYNTTLGSRYVVGVVLENTGDAVTYLGLDTMTQQIVRIREFFPIDLCKRDSSSEKIVPNEESNDEFNKLKREFLDIYHGLKNLKSLKSAICVLDVFEANKTAYAVSEADGSMTLTDYLMQNGNTLDLDSIKTMLLPSLELLKSMHALGIAHGAISPDTLFLCADGTFKLWGFSVRELRQVGTCLSPELIDNYCAAEQYRDTETLGAYTDVYAFCAVLYRCLTGQAPQSAEERLTDDTLTIPAEVANDLPEYVITALVGGLQLFQEDRIRTIDELEQNLDEEKYNQKKELLAQQKALFNEQNNVFTNRDNGAEVYLVDPLSEISGNELQNKKTTREKKKREPKANEIVEPVPLNPTTPDVIPVVKRDRTTPQEHSNQAASTILLAMCIVLVMLVFFATLTVTGVISFNVSTKGQSVEKVFEMPDFKGVLKTDESIEKMAKEYNLNITLQPDNSTEVPENQIMTQSVAPGTKIATGSSITLTYSKGAATVTLPNFVGLPFTETVYYFGKLNLKYNITEKQNPGDKAVGTIASMNPPAGSIVEEGSEITIEIWGDSNIISNQGQSGQTSSDEILSSVLGRLTDRLSSLIGG